MQVVQDLHAAAFWEASNDAVDAVQRGARHQADEEVTRPGHVNFALNGQVASVAASIGAADAAVHALSHLQLRLNAGYGLFELRAGVVRQRHGLGGASDHAGVLVGALDAEFEVQMWACSPAGCANGTQPLALLNALALFHVDAAQVGVDGRAIAVVPHMDHIAEAVLPAGKLNQAVANGADRSAGWCAVVHAKMGAPSLVNRVESASRNQR